MGWANHIADMDAALDWRDRLCLASDRLTNDLGQLCPSDAQEVIDEIEALRSLCLDAAAALVGPSDIFEGCQEVIDKIHAHLGKNVNTAMEGRGDG